MPVAALHGGNPIMQPTAGMAAVLPFHILADIAGAVVVATIWLQQKELRMAAILVWPYRQNRVAQIADIMLKRAQKKQMKSMAEAIAQLYRPRKGPRAGNDERPCDS